MPKSITRFSVRGMAVALLLALTLVPYFYSSAATTTAALNGVVINEVLVDPNGSLNFDTDNNGTAGDFDEFVEIYNTTASPVDISGWQLWDAGGGGYSWFTFPAGTSLGAGNYAVVVVDISDNGTLPPVSGGNLAFDAQRTSGVINNGGDDVVLYAPNLDKYVQLVFNGNAADNPLTYAGFSATATREGDIENWGSDLDGSSLVRYPAGDTAVDRHLNVSDYLASPGADTIPATPFGACGDSATLISAVQGTGLTSPIAGIRTTVEAVVVADFQGGGLNGFNVQEEDSDVDADPVTSEGLFIYDPTVILDVTVGDVVRLSGFVGEFRDQTQITASQVVNCGTAVSLPTVASLSLPFSSTDAPEAVEGMKIEFTQTLYVTETFTLGRYGEVVLSANSRLYNPTELAAPGSAEYFAINAANDLNRIMLDDASNVENPDPIPYLSSFAPETMRIGDVTSSDVSGVMGQAFGAYRIQPTASVTFSPMNLRSNVTLPPTPALRVASFNVLNYFTTLGSRGAGNAFEFERQEDKIIDALATINADVFGLMEIENNNDVAVTALVDALNTYIGSNTYAYIATGVTGDNVGGTEGPDAITVAIIYKPASVTPIGTTAVIETGTFDGLSRPPVAQAFQTTNGTQFVVVVNHFKSKGCDNGSADADKDQGDGQGCFNATRTASAIELTNWLATDPTGTGVSDVVIIGDLNAYSQEDPIKALETTFTNLMTDTIAETDRYSYMFFGEAGVLDHALGGGEIPNRVQDVTIYHINADEPPALDYNDYNNDASLYTADMWRSSDHDPVVIDFRAPGVEGIISADEQVVEGTTVTVSVADADLDLDSGAIDTVAISVYSDGGEFETIELTETAVDSGVFTSAISLTVATPTPDNSILETTGNTLLVFTYIDALDGSGGVNTVETALTLVGENEFTLVSPADGAYFRSGAEISEISWTPAKGAIQYEIVVFKTSSNVVRVGEAFRLLANSSFCNSDLCTLSLAPAQQDLITSGQYEWTVVADTEFGEIEAGNAPFGFVVELGTIELIENGGFEGPRTAGQPEGWRAVNTSKDRVKCNTDTRTFTIYGNCAYQFKSSLTENSRLIQKIAKKLVRDGDTLTFSMAVDARNVPAGTRVARLVVKYSDNTTSKINLNIPEPVTVRDFTALSDSLVLDLSSVDVKNIKVIVGWRGTQGRFIADEVSLTAAPAEVLSGGIIGDSVPLPQAPDGSEFRRGN